SMRYRKVLQANGREASMLKIQARIDPAHAIEIDARRPPYRGDGTTVLEAIAGQVETRYDRPGEFERRIGAFYKEHRIRRADQPAYRNTAMKAAFDGMVKETPLQGIRIIADPKDEIVGGNQ